MLTPDEFLNDLFTQLDAYEDGTLTHADPNYDPVKAHEYYLLRRQLKGRQRGPFESDGVRVSAGQPKDSANKGPTKPDAPQPRGDQHAAQRKRRAEIEAQVEALEGRLKQLRKVLSELVKAAKAKAGVDDETEKDAEKDSKNSKLTAAEKREKAKKDKARRAKEKEDTPTAQLKAVQEQIAAIQEKIAKARADLREAISKARDKSGSSNQN